MTDLYKAKNNAAFYLHNAGSALEVFSQQITNADADQVDWEAVEDAAHVVDEAVDMMLKSLRNKIPNL